MLAAHLPNLKAEEYKPNANPAILEAQVDVIIGRIERALEDDREFDQSLSAEDQAGREQMKAEVVESRQRKLEDELEEEKHDLQENLRAFRPEGELSRQLTRHDNKTARLREANKELRRQIASPESLNALTKSVPVMPHEPGTTAQVRLLVTAFFDWLAAGTVETVSEDVPDSLRRPLQATKRLSRTGSMTKSGDDGRPRSPERLPGSPMTNAAEQAEMEAQLQSVRGVKNS
jgi:hypothetical protein